MDQDQVNQLKVASHFAILVYPFCHTLSNLSDKQRADRIENLKGSWQHGWSRFDPGQMQAALDDTYFFLPYIRDWLFPETKQLANQDATAKNFPYDAVLRLTCKPESLKSLDTVQLHFERKDKSGKVFDPFRAAFHLCWADVALFPHNVGFLMMKVKAKEEGLAVCRLNRLISHLRLVRPPNAEWGTATLRRDGEPDTIFKIHNLIDYLLEGLADLPLSPLTAPAAASFGKLHPHQCYTETDFGKVYGQTLNVYTYACLAGPAGDEDKTASSGQVEKLFDSPIQQTLYELATCTDTTNPDYAPHPSHVKSLFERGSLSFWNNWEGMALHDNVVFLGTEQSDYVMGELARNVEGKYFHLYLLTLFQKMWLSKMFGELIRRDTDLPRNLREARRLWSEFVMFQNRYWFSEVTRKPQGTELYRRFQQGLNVLALYEEMNEQMNQLQDHYERRFERGISSLLNFLTFIGLPAGLLISLFSNSLIQGATWKGFIITGVIMYVATFLLWLVWRYLRRD
jgi:hypothetical protein